MKFSFQRHLEIKYVISSKEIPKNKSFPTANSSLTKYINYVKRININNSNKSNLIFKQFNKSCQNMKVLNILCKRTCYHMRVLLIHNRIQ